MEHQWKARHCLAASMFSVFSDPTARELEFQKHQCLVLMVSLKESMKQAAWKVGVISMQCGLDICHLFNWVHVQTQSQMVGKNQLQRRKNFCVVDVMNEHVLRVGTGGGGRSPLPEFGKWQQAAVGVILTCGLTCAWKAEKLVWTLPSDTVAVLGSAQR
jgi:hypothetical protein